MPTNLQSFLFQNPYKKCIWKRDVNNLGVTMAENGTDRFKNAEQYFTVSDNKGFMSKLFIRYPSKYSKPNNIILY